MTYNSIVSALNADKPLVIMGHNDPDGDCVGSMLAIYHAFDGKAKGWKMLLQDEIADNLAFLPEAEQIGLLPQDYIPERLLLVDCHDLQRANRMGLTNDDITELYVIDHHLALNTDDYKIIEHDAAACCELIYKILSVSDMHISKDTALCLYTGIVSDTGCFKQANTTSATLAAASELLKYGVDTEKVRINLFESRTFANIKMLGIALSSAELFHDNQLCFMSVSMSDKMQYNAKADDCTSIVSHTLTSVGTQIGVFFEEREGGIVRMSFRSREGYDMQAIAASLGGGGHKLASGATVQGCLPDVMQQVYQIITDKYFNITEA